MNTRAAIIEALGVDIRAVAPLSGGCVGEVLGVELADGTSVVAKLDPTGTGGLEVEAAMLEDLIAAGAPAPRVRFASPTLLVMERLVGSTGARGEAEEDLADVLAELHAHSADRFGYRYATRIGGLVQPNPWCESWVEFFAEQRLVAFARSARDADRLPAAVCRDVERLAARLGDLLEEPRRPGLLHGDLWSGNVLSDASRITGLIDPALHYGHPEVELAFTKLFGSFGERFDARYRDRTGGPDAAFWSERKDLYNLYPLLVHARLFGGGYVDDVRRLVRRYGGAGTGAR